MLTSFMMFLQKLTPVIENAEVGVLLPTKEFFPALLLMLGLCISCLGGELQGSLCACTLCLNNGAVSLSIEDERGNSIEDFVVEVLLNNESLGQPAGCTPEEREGSNSCFFGSELGYYYVIVNAPGYAQQEAAIRVFDEGEREVCCRACLSARVLTLTLEPLEG